MDKRVEKEKDAEFLEKITFYCDEHEKYLCDAEHNDIKGE